MNPLKTSLLLPLALIVLSGCSDPVATLIANVSVVGDTTGAQSASATVNFTSFVQSPGGSPSDDHLILHFFNSEGDTMDFILSPVTTGTPSSMFPAGQYDLDGATNAFTSSFTVVSAGVPRTIDVNATEGYLTITSIVIDSGGLIRSIAGTFAMNFDLGGGGQGSLNATE